MDAKPHLIRFSKPLYVCCTVAARLIILLAGLVACTALASTDNTEPHTNYEEAEAFLDKHCSRCHNDERMSGNWSLSAVNIEGIATGTGLAEWENILRVTQRGEMPPQSRPQPHADELHGFIRWLEGSLDDYAAANPNPGRATLRRLNRSEYSNAVRDLLSLDVDIRESLPTDDTGYGFDNIADVLSVSPTLMDRYLAVAGRVSRLAVGLAPEQPSTFTYLLPKEGSILNQGIPSYDQRMSDNLPLDSRGGGAFNYFAPYDGIYEIGGYLNSNTNNEVDQLSENRVSLQVPLTAGAHSIGITFRKQLALDESVQTLRNTTDEVHLPIAPPIPITLDFVVDGARVGSTSVPSYHMSSRYAQQNFPRDVLEIDVAGPYDVSGPGNTPSREKIFSCTPSIWPFTENYCARKIIGRLARQAYRRPVTDADIDRLMVVYSQAQQAADFENGIAASIQAILVSPSFLFLHEQEPQQSEPGSVHPLNDVEYAARLALFLWSSLPDEELIALAEKGKLRKPEILAQQVDRMLADDRAKALVENFAGQWLYLRNLEFSRPDVVEFPDFDLQLKQAMKRESELFFDSIMRDNASILDFIKSDYTYLNERLAEHYGIDGVSGPMFRKVALPEESMRGGLLGQGSILTVTSYANHTSVVLRGKWILDNLLAAPPPPPPPDIPALQTKNAGKALNAREQLALHSEDPACASCHVRMDPLGLALEKYDAVGKLRLMDAGRPIDVSAKMPDGKMFEGLYGLQTVLMERKQQFASAFTQRLMTYALGRGVEAIDQPKVRTIVRAAEEDDYRIRSIVFGILTSEPFNYRRAPNHD
jgi:hypothetical protein